MIEACARAPHRARRSLGVALVLRPTLDQQQLWHGLAGLLSGMLSAMAYLQVTTLGRAGEPATRIVFYFSMGGAVLAGCSGAPCGRSALAAAAEMRETTGAVGWCGAENSARTCGHFQASPAPEIEATSASALAMTSSRPRPGSARAARG